MASGTVETSLLDYLPDAYRSEPHMKRFVGYVAAYALADLITAGEAGQLMMHANDLLSAPAISPTGQTSAS